VEADLRQRGAEPLLEGGHSYSNIYRAGAAFSRYCSQDLAPHTLLERLHPLKSLVLGLAYAPKFLRLAAQQIERIIVAVIAKSVPHPVKRPSRWPRHANVQLPSADILRHLGHHPVGSTLQPHRNNLLIRRGRDARAYHAPD